MRNSFAGQGDCYSGGASASMPVDFSGSRYQNARRPLRGSPVFFAKGKICCLASNCWKGACSSPPRPCRPTKSRSPPLSAPTSLASTDATTIRNAVAGQMVTKADKALGVKWAKGVDAKYKLLVKANTVGQAAVNKDLAKLDTATGARAAAAAKLTAAANKALAAITTDSHAIHTADAAGLAAIGRALPSDSALQTAITTVESNGATALAGIQTDAGTVFTTDVGEIVAPG